MPVHSSDKLIIIYYSAAMGAYQLLLRAYQKCINAFCGQPGKGSSLLAHAQVSLLSAGCGSAPAQTLFTRRPQLPVISMQLRQSRSR